MSSNQIVDAISLKFPAYYHYTPIDTVYRWSDRQYGYGQPTYHYARGFGADSIVYGSYTRDKAWPKTTLTFQDGQLEDAVFTRSGWDLLIRPFGNHETIKVEQYFAEFHNYGSSFYQTHKNIQFEFNGQTYGYEDILTRIVGLAGPEGLSGSSQNDVLFGGTGENQLSGEAGDDTLYGFEGNDVLSGGSGNDELHGHDGNDILLGGDGNDVLYAGFGNDTLTGGAGDDMMYDTKINSYGENTVQTFIFASGHGKDTVILNSDLNGLNIFRFQNTDASSAVYSRQGSDLLIQAYGDGSQVLVRDVFGDEGEFITNDVQFEFADKKLTSAEVKALINGLNLPDTETINRIAGTWEDDALAGSSGKDEITGGGGNDTFIGEAGNDTLIGSYGADTYVFERGHGADIIQESSSQLNTLLFNDAQLADAQFIRSGNDLIIKAYGGEDQVAVQNYFSYIAGYFQFAFSDQTLTAEDMGQVSIRFEGSSRNDDYLAGAATQDEIYGNAGNDQLFTYAGNDTLVGGSGDDLLSGGEGADTYIFERGHGHDKVFDYGEGAADTNTLRFKGANYFYNYFSRSGNDLIINAFGQNSGDSVVIRRYFAGQIYLSENDQTANQDYRYYQFEFDDETITYQDMASLSIRGAGSANDDILLGSNTLDTIFAGLGNDQVAGGSGNDQLYGGAGNDQLWGDAGDDGLYGENGDDTLTGGEGRDTLSGGHGNDKLSGGDGDDRLEGDNGNDELDGGNGNDRIFGGNGNDTLVGGFGNDTLNGGTGGDTYVFSKLYGQDVITDVGRATEKDTIRFTDIRPEEIIFKKEGNHLILSDAEEGSSVQLSNFFSSSVFQIEIFEFEGQTITNPDFVKYTNNSDQSYSMAVFPVDITVNESSSAAIV